MLLNIVAFSCCALNFLLVFASLFFSVRLRRKANELDKATKNIQQMDKLYCAMATELHNIAESIELRDMDGVAIFFKKLEALHNQFMAIGKEDK
jgi:hypothetical protein